MLVKHVTDGGLDEAYSRNLFLVLGKYVSRQDENLLTQALVLLFNRVLSFRRAFCDLLGKRPVGQSVPIDSLIARSQVGRHLYGRRILVDMEIRREGSDSPIYLIESKLESGLGISQIKNYGAALKKERGSTRLVLITKYGLDQDLWKYAPRETIWLSWSMVAEIAALSLRRASGSDQFLIKDFLDMTSLKGILTVPRMTTDSFRRLAIFSKFSFDKHQDVDHKTVEALSVALQRLKEHRDSAWESLLAGRPGWTPYQRVYKWGEKQRAVLEAGFCRQSPRRNIQESYLGLELACGEKPRLYMVRGWKLRPSHPRYERDMSHEYEEWEMSVPETRTLFKIPMPHAIKNLEKDLRRFGLAFMRSSYAGSN